MKIITSALITLISGKLDNDNAIICSRIYNTTLFYIQQFMCFIFRNILYRESLLRYLN